VAIEREFVVINSEVVVGQQEIARGGQSAVALALFLIVVTIVSILWGRTNRIGYSRVITSAARFIMKYSQMNEELIRSYLVWWVYMFVGLIGAVALLAAYQVDLFRFLALDSEYLWVIPLAFIAQNSLTGLMMQLWLVARPKGDVFSDLTSVLWVRYTLMMPRVMRLMAPLSAAVIEEVFFRGAVFLILIKRFPQIGAYWPIFVCTALFVLQQLLQTDTVGQRVIFLVGSTSVSVVGCLATLYTGSFLPTLVCHGVYAVLYLQLGTLMPKWQPIKQGAKPSATYPRL
jgi:membrane protease YdiL (CAAX protease family)